jgi:protein-S-isoprenylcysteine O-methyltransferase Ste14
VVIIQKSAPTSSAAGSTAPHASFGVSHGAVIAGSGVEEGVVSQSFLTRAAAFVVRRRVPISIVCFGGLGLYDLVSGVVPHDVFDSTDVKSMIALAILVMGLGLRTWAAGFLIKDSQLTTAGPYAMVRNPLYLGSFLMVAAFSLILGATKNFYMLPALLLVIYSLKIRDEERGLSRRYTRDWTAYAKRTPRLWPKLSHRPQFAGWKLSHWLQSREYQAVLACTAAVVGLRVLRQFMSV